MRQQQLPRPLPSMSVQRNKHRKRKWGNADEKTNGLAMAGVSLLLFGVVVVIYHLVIPDNNKGDDATLWMLQGCVVGSGMVLFGMIFIGLGWNKNKTEKKARLTL